MAFNQETLAARRQPSREDRGKYVFRKTKQVLEKHSGSGVKALRLNLSTCGKDDVDTGLLDQWLRAFVKPGIAELTVMLPHCYAHEYNFPYSILESTSDDGEASSSSSSSSIESLYLASCGFHHPTPKGHHPRRLGCSRSLSKVCLRKVSLNSEELEHFLSRCYALERLDISDCDTITSLKIPRVLKKLSMVRVQMCRALQTIESNAPRISNFHYQGGRSSPLLRFSLGDSLETKELDVHATSMVVDVIQYAGSNLPSVAPNLEHSYCQQFMRYRPLKLKAPVMMLDKFQKLKHLVICLGASGGFCTGYDFVSSLACFLDACPSLETFTLRIEDGFAWYKKYAIVGKPDDQDSSQPQHDGTPELHHGGLGNLKKATITGFCSAKSLIKLTCHILERATPSLQCLTLDASPGYDRKGFSGDRCFPMRADALRDAERAIAAVRRFVVPRVPAGVQLKVLGPCDRCHAMDAKAMEEAESRTPRRFLQRQADGSIALVIIQPRGTDVP
ncbi:hypothetical protein PR202_gb00627 [Eleusine coracana subsp. coracana]|uniref:At1g61320/AtMIF1 LRR domain-containing protein n=1 Tax=Eleusine coracana subsp. coracana TaxID=191504 RepID=A0AAV5DU59_ELECO|nr:hypothetical protein PR202_gb00627 [Eleusine coracana subsp. coracana]